MGKMCTILILTWVSEAIRNHQIIRKINIKTSSSTEGLRAHISHSFNEGGTKKYMKEKMFYYTQG